MNRKTLFLASLPIMVTPLFSLTATPAKAVSLNRQAQMSSELVSASNSHNSLLIADRYDGERNDNWRHYDRYNEQWHRDHDNDWHHDRNDYRWHRDHDNDWRYRDRNRAGIIFRF